MNMRLKQVWLCLFLNSFVLFAGSPVFIPEPQTFFDDCVKKLEDDNHYLFSADDAAKLKGDMRYERFSGEYKRFVEEAVRQDETAQHTTYRRDEASALMCNAFIRWHALKSLGDNVATCSKKQLYASLVHTNYLLHAFAPQDLKRSDLCPTFDFEKISQLMKLQFDVQQELAMRDAAEPTFALKTITEPQSATWIFGDTYQSVTSSHWDSTGHYLICLALKNGKQVVLVYSYSPLQMQLTQDLEMAVDVPAIPGFFAQYVIWGATSQSFILGGNAIDGTKAAAYLYTYNSVQKTAQQQSLIHQIPSLSGVAQSAFWSNDFTRLCLVHAGECFVFLWHQEMLSFELERRVYPGLKYVRSASLSFDLSCYLTSHSEYPFLRISKKDAPFGAFSAAHSRDKLMDGQWNPQHFYFVARSAVEADVIVLFAYSPSTEKVLMLQRVHVGSAISSMKWSNSGQYLFVTCEPSSFTGVGLRAYVFTDGVLSMADSIDALAGQVCTVQDCAYADEQHTLVIAGLAQNNTNGSIVRFPPLNAKKNAPARSVVKSPVIAPMISVHARSIGEKDVVHHYLSDVPNAPTVGFGSLVMLVDPLKPTVALSACDAPEMRSIHNGKAFPCARQVRTGDFSGEFLSAWWLIEGEAWTERLNVPVKPVARMRLRNLATGEYLTITREHAPVYGIAATPHAALAGPQEAFLSIKRPQDVLSPWRIGEGVHLCSGDLAFGVDTVQPTKHPILSHLGISSLVAESVASLEARGGLAPSFWAVSRNIPVSRVLEQAAQGSECCGLLKKRLENVIPHDDFAQIQPEALAAV